LKAPSFAYAKPRSLAEAFDLLERPGAKILAGGQSLIPSLNLRLSSPELLVDITGIKGLSKIEVEGGMRDGFVRIGALCTQAELERSAELKQHLPLVADAVSHIAHPAIRNRGTIGGSLALADPAAELPACALALDATLIVSARRGERRVKALGFFKGLFETDLKRGEVLVGAEFPKAEKSVFLELTRRQGDYAIVGLAGITKSSQKNISFFGVAATAVLAKQAAKAKTLEEAKAALAKDLAPTADLYHSSPTKMHLAKVLLERAWNRL
jgi:aerobic carbon-monoxide dehydrogenase medium subunit